MPTLPFPLQGNSIDELRAQILDMFRDLYEIKVGGAMVGDVFAITSDVLSLRVKTGSGLKKTAGQLDFDVAAISAPAAAVMQSNYTNKGVLISASAASTIVVVTVGSDGQVLTANSAQASGLAWATPAGGDTGTITYAKDGGGTGTITVVNGHITAFT